VVEVLIEGKRLDVFEGFDFSFNYGVADIRNPEKRSTEYSKTINCPATKNNDALFGHIYDVNISNNYDANTSNISVNFNPNKKADARVIADGVEVMAGVVQLRKVVQKGHAYTYEVVFIGKLLNIFSKIGDKQLSGTDENGLRLLDLSEYNHYLTRANQSASWSATVGEGYVYPLIDWGDRFIYTSAGNRIYEVSDLRPSVYVKTLVDKIFDFAGFTYTSSFFNTNTFKRLIVPISKKLNLPENQIEPRQFKAVKSLPQIMSRFASQSPNTFGNEQIFNPSTGQMAKLCFEDDSVLGFDNNDQYRILSTQSPFVPYNYNAANNYIFVCQETLRYDTFKCSIDLQVTKNSALSGVFEGTVDIVRWVDSSQTLEVVAESVFYFDISGANGTQTQTIYVEGDTFSENNDQVYIRLNSDRYANGYKPDYRNSATGLGSVALDVRCTGGYFENQPITDELFEGDLVTLSDHLPDVEMKGFLTSIFKMFNLYVEADPNNESNLLIETRDDFYKAGGTKDWTYKLARDRDIALEPLGVLTDREYIYTYKEDGDYYNQRYQNNRGHAYGRQRIEVDNDFVQSTKEVSVIFSPTPLVNDNPSNRIIPKIYDADIEDGYKPTDTNIRIMYYGGLIPSNPSWKHRQKYPFWWEFDRTEYPYAGHWDNPLTPTLDINFGLILEMYYQTNGYTGQLQVTNAGLYNVYHRNYINEITDKDSKVMTAMFYLEPTDINTLDFRDQIVIDNAYWRLNKVMNYNPFKEGLTKVELIKIKEPVTFQKKSKKLNLGGLIGKERMPNPSTEIKTNGNRYPAFQGKVSGRENSVGHSVTAFKVVGSNNTIGEGSRNIVILGDRNEVIGGLHNVQLINTNGVTITESNTTFINGKQQENRDVLDGSKDSVRALNGGTNIFTVDGGEDIVQTQFSNSAIYLIEGGID
jgi:hypothetical protein